MKFKKVVISLFLVLFLFSGMNCMSPTFSTVMVMENITATWLNRWYVSEAIHQLHEEHTRNQLVLIRYYVDSTDSNPYPRLACKEAEDRMKWYMTDKGLPTTFFNGTEYIKGSLPNPEDDSIQGRIKKYNEVCSKKALEINARVPPVSIWAACQKKEAKDDFTIEVSVKAIDKVANPQLQLNIALVESNLSFEAINGETVHFQVFREWIKPPDIKDKIGIPFTISEFGDQFETQFTYHLNSELYKKDLAIILFVQDMKTKAILQGMQINMK